MKKVLRENNTMDKHKTYYEVRITNNKTGKLEQACRFDKIEDTRDMIHNYIISENNRDYHKQLIKCEIITDLNNVYELS